MLINQFRYIKIQSGNRPHKLCCYSHEPRAEVYCFRLNFNIYRNWSIICILLLLRRSAYAYAYVKE